MSNSLLIRPQLFCSYLRILCSLFQPYDLLIQHHKFLFHHHVFMVVPEEPVFELASLSNLIEKVCQGIPLEQPAAECVLNAAGAAVGDDVVHIPTCFVQCFSCGPVFVLAGQFLFPPGAVIDSVESTCGVELPKLSLIVWIVRLQNAVSNVVTAGPTHGKDFLSADLVELSSHQVQDAGTDRLHQTAMPLTCRVTSEQIIVFVIPTDEQGGE